MERPGTRAGRLPDLAAQGGWGRRGRKTELIDLDLGAAGVLDDEHLHDPVMLCGVRPTGAQRILERDGEVLAYFTLAGMAAEEAAPGVLRYSPGHGPSVRLLDAPPGWPTKLGHRGELTVHGVSVEGSNPFTLLGTRVSSLAMGDRATGLQAATLALGAHLERDTTWSTATYGTAHLHEWLGDTGLQIDAEHDQRGQTQRLSHRWAPPPSHEVDLPDARLTIGPAMEDEAGCIADWVVRTETHLSVRPAQPMTVAALERRFARPLLAFSVLAADRPDAIIYEAVSDAERQQRAVILRMGSTVVPREWRPDDRFLFRAEQIDDVADIYARWMALWEEAGPEIATFVDAVNEGSSYGRARLLASVVALEAYWRTRVRQAPAGPKRSLSLTGKLKELRDHSGIDPAQISATNKNLKLLVGARNLYAHLNQTTVQLSDEEIDDALLPNCRRATALMQACLLRDLGISAAQINDMFAEHQRSWPLA